MKYLILTALALLTVFNSVFAQYTTVQLDAGKDYFNDGQPLVSEKPLMFTGVLPADIRLVEVIVLPHKDKDSRVPLYQASFSAPEGTEMQNFAVPMNFKLRSSEKYDFHFNYFRELNGDEKEQIRRYISDNIEAYLNVNLTGEKNIKLEKSPKKLTEGMNDILRTALTDYRKADVNTQTQFSEIVTLKAEYLEKEDLSRDYVKKDSTMTLAQVRENARRAATDDMTEQLNREIDQIIEGDWLILDRTRVVNDYETESKQNFLSVSFGYGGAYLSGKLSEDFDYGSSPFLGLSVPLGNSTFAPKVLSNASLTLGAFTQNFENNDGREISGVLFNRPWFAGLDYKLFQFVRFTGGATFLQGVEGDGSKGEVNVRPFIGVGARINLNFSLEK